MGRPFSHGPDKLKSMMAESIKARSSYNFLILSLAQCFESEN